MKWKSKETVCADVSEIVWEWIRSMRHTNLQISLPMIQEHVKVV